MLPMALCADARLDGEALIGDPTEGALIVLAEKGGISVDDAREMFPRVAELPFDSDYKFMATFHNMTERAGQAGGAAFVKGAPDVLIARGGYYWLPGDRMWPSPTRTALALLENERMAGRRARHGGGPPRLRPRHLRPQGQPDRADHRPDADGHGRHRRSAARRGPRRHRQVPQRRHPGAHDHRRPRRDRGGHRPPAGHRGHGPHRRPVQGHERRRADEGLDEIGVVARVAPEDKIRLVDLLQRKQNIVAMTGDGVNDAPALKKADIGVAMGITGTEVSKGAAVMILTDDNFATIVKAVEFGRAIYDNLSNFIRFQMTALVGFIAAYLGAAFFVIAGGVPFTPFVVLWINFLVQVPVAVALGFDKPAPGLMEHKPRPLSQPVLSRSQWVRIAFLGLLMAIGTLYLEATYAPAGAAVAATMAFVVFSLFNIVIALSARSETGSAFNRDIFHDRSQLMLYGLALLFIILPVELGFPRFLGLAQLSGDQWHQGVIGFAFALLLVDEVPTRGVHR
jgi:P-type Ca2+ transporter type 2C